MQEFWREEIWTTTMYRANLELEGRCPELAPTVPGIFLQA